MEVSEPRRKRKYVAVKQKGVKQNLASVCWELSELQKRLESAEG